MLTRLARLRVPLGFIAAAVAFVLARPSWQSLSIGFAVAFAGEALRVWAAGHIEKGREITRSGPYRVIRHPLYFGSMMLAVGFAIGANSAAVGVLAAVYLGVTFYAAIRSEEAALDAKFPGAYTEYRAGRATPVDRPFTWARVIANREYRAMLGFVAAFLFLLWRVPR
jgi:protein-S-isoprenylcysteine O-methyltransferase Ste14